MKKKQEQQNGLEKTLVITDILLQPILSNLIAHGQSQSNCFIKPKLLQGTIEFFPSLTTDNLIQL